MGMEHKCSLKVHDCWSPHFHSLKKRVNCQIWPFFTVSHSLSGKEQRVYLYYQKCMGYLQSVFSFVCSSKPIKVSAINTKMITNLLNSKITTNYQLSGGLKVENVIIIALINFDGLLKDTVKSVWKSHLYLHSLCCVRVNELQ